jgi:hypothetical protein
MAGLTVANALAQAGVACVVVEARERVGGRLHTIDFPGGPVDMGGSWIHHPIGNPLRAFADQVGVACREGDPLPEMAAFDCGEGRRLSTGEVRAELSTLSEALPAAIDSLRGAWSPMRQPRRGRVRGRKVLMLRGGGRQVGRDGVIRDLPERQSCADGTNPSTRVVFGDLPSGSYREARRPVADGGSWLNSTS